jgi:hypothetical protein
LDGSAANLVKSLSLGSADNIAAKLAYAELAYFSDSAGKLLLGDA